MWTAGKYDIQSEGAVNTKRWYLAVKCVGYLCADRPRHPSWINTAQIDVPYTTRAVEDDVARINWCSENAIELLD